MEVLMILRLQIACLCFTAAVAMSFFMIKRTVDFANTLFRLLIFCQIISLSFDMITVYTVNNLDTVPPLLNKIFHIIFIFSLCFFIYLSFIYVLHLATRNTSKIRLLAYGAPLFISLIVIIFTPLDYVQTPYGNYSEGLGVTSIYATVAIYLVFMVAIMFRHGKEMDGRKRSVMLIAVLSKITISIAQLFIPTLLITSLGSTIIVFSIYLTIENPDRILRRLYYQEKQLAEEATRAKSKFLATMSHEIRTPLNAIIGIAEIQMRKDGVAYEDASAYKTIFASGGHLLGIINDILDLSKIEAGKMELILAQYDVPSLISDMAQLNIVRIGSKPIKFILDVDENLPSKLYGDELRLKQILDNILSNAIKYTKKGYVKLSVGTEGGGAAGGAVAAVGRADPDTPWGGGAVGGAVGGDGRSGSGAEGDFVTLHIAVEDTGQGMKIEDKKQLFSEYLRLNSEANRTTEGTGLGLSITKQLVELMGGTIDVQSEYGKGSVFTFTVKQKGAGGDVIGAEIADQLRNFTFTHDRQIDGLQIFRHPMPYGSVLVADDLEANLFVAQGLLAPYRLSVETAESGFEVIDKIKDGKTYDVIFMDYMMPHMDGIEATGKLRNLGYEGTIVALTANALVGNDGMFAENGFDGFLPKPIDVRQLDEVLNRFVRDRHPQESEKYAPLPQAAVLGAGAPENGEQAIDPKLMEVFIRSAKKSVATLRGAAASEDTKLLAITAHAMKSALLNIGERGMSEEAFALEKAGLDGDADFIAANVDGFIELLEGLCERLGLQAAAVGGRAPAFVGRADPGTPQEGGHAGPPLQEQLQILKTACEAYDFDAVFAALDLLKGEPWAPDAAAALEEIHDILYLDSDFDGAAERTAALLGGSK